MCDIFEHPYTFARRLSTAGHHTKGRVGWNIVTSYLESGARNIGQGGLRRHDNRYEVAAEYVEVLYKLLEGSWEQGAVLRDAEKRVFVPGVTQTAPPAPFDLGQVLRLGCSQENKRQQSVDAFAQAL